MTDKYSDDFLQLLKSVVAKRSKTVIDHILKFGFITSQELKDIYGYNHPPRAIRDVREYGIPIITYRITGTDGRNIAAYKFGAFNRSNNLLKASGRTAISKTIKNSLINKYGSKCFIFLEVMDRNILQVDHRIPYEISGESSFIDVTDDDSIIESYMLLSPSANRAKSWTCEHCKNWGEKNKIVCSTCFWAYPENYEHIAGKKQKIISITFQGNEIHDYNQLISISGMNGAITRIKNLIKNFLKKLRLRHNVWVCYAIF